MTRLLPVAAVGALLAASAASAHPLPNTRYDRTVAVRVGPDSVQVKYTLEVSQFTIFLDGAKLFTADEIARLDKSGRGFVLAYAKKVAPEIARDLRAASDGVPLTFAVEKIELEEAEHPRFRFEFRAPWPPGPEKRALAFDDDSFRDKPGVLALTLADAGSNSGVSFDDLIEPDPRWRDRPTIDLTPEQATQLRKASAVVKLPRAIADPKGVKDLVAVAPGSPDVIVTDPAERPSLAADLAARGLPALFDSSAGLGMLLLAAFLFGAAHAFTPGHGKTLVAAYLVGERGTVGHALILALTTTVAHTGSVIAVAAVLWGVYGNEVPLATQGVLQFLGGVLVAAVGAWLLMRRVTGRADHFHFPGAGHHHHHGDGHDHHHHHGPPPEDAKTTFGWTRLILMGLGGGLIPCWDAVLLLLAATALNRVGFAVPLLLAFSVGLGAVLVLLGVSVVYAHRAGAVRFAESRWFKFLPVVSAGLLLGIGLWLCREGLKAATG